MVLVPNYDYQIMSKHGARTRWLVSGVYAFGQILLGFLLHPYQTTYNLVKDKYLSFLCLLPMVILLALVFIWRRAVFPLFDHFDFAGGYFTELIKFSVLFFCVIWQIMLIYLLIKFRKLS